MLPTVQTPRPLTQTDRDPFGEVDRIVRDLTTWADTVRWADGDGVMTALGDLEELDDAFVLEVDLPGIAKGDVDVELDGRRLVVTAERRARRRAGLLRRRTRHVGSYRHEVLLPDDVDPEGVRAQLADGVLTVRLPKASTGRRRRITVH